MRSSHDPVELIRHTNPVPDPRELPDPGSAEAQALLGRVLDAGHHGPGIVVGLRRRRRTLLLAAVFLVLTGASAAVAAGLFSPDPEDVAAVLEDRSTGAAAHIPGWRPELSTEAVWCMYSPSEGAWTSASWFPLDEAMTAEDLIEECVAGNDVARNQPAAPQVTTLCRGEMTADAYRERFASTGETVLAGEVGAGYHGFPVVLAWGADCAATQLETSWPVTLAPLISMEDVNWARQIEIEVGSESARRCVPETEAGHLAEDAVQRLGPGWLLTEHHGLIADCFQVVLEAEWGIVTVLGDDTPPLDETPSS